MTPAVRRVLELRLALSQAATSKYAALVNRQHEGRIKDAFVFRGASRTGRWAGQGLQIQNMKKPPYGVDPAEVADSILDGTFEGGSDALERIGGSIRSTIAAGPGKLLVVQDLASIESRIAGWISGDRALQQVFADNLDPYKAFAVEWLKVPYDQVTKEQRNLSKPPTLGCGYGMHLKGLQKYAQQYGVTLTEEQALSAVQAFRTTYWSIPVMWKWLDMAFRNAIIGTRTEGYRLVLRREGDMVTLQLPRGRKLYYHRPCLGADNEILYWGLNSFTHRWEQIRTYGAKVFENVCQAIAADVLGEAMLAADKAGLAIVLHLHDEVGVEADEDRVAETWARLHQCLITAPSWAAGLPLAAEGYIAKRFKKD